MKNFMRAFLLLSPVVATSAPACELASTKIEFPGMGTHTAWFCKATEAEKAKALALFKADACVAKKLKTAGQPVQSAVATDVIPYWLTKEDARRAGPMLDLRITLGKAGADARSVEKRVGYRAIASSQKFEIVLPGMPGGANGPVGNSRLVRGIQFQLDQPMLFEIECPASGCTEKFTPLCPQQSLGDLDENI